MYYEPWVGNFYQKKPYDNIRILLVGESSYERDFESTKDHLKSDTKDVANGEFATRYSGFWRFIQRSVTGCQTITQQNQYDFWQAVCLVNLVQRPMSDKDSRPTECDFVEGVLALEQYVEALSPSGVIVYSKSAQQYLMRELKLAASKQLTVEGEGAPALVNEHASVYTSNALSSSPNFLVLKHPSSRPKMAALTWSPLIKKFLEECKHA